MGYATTAELAWALHISRPFSDEENLYAERCAAAATAEIDAWVDWPDGPDPDTWDPDEEALVNRVCVLRAVEWWKANDAAFGLIGSAELGALRAPRDGFARHGLTLIPLKQRFGVA